MTPETPAQPARRRFPDWLFSLLAITVCFAAALWLRAALPWETILGGKWVKFSGPDSYYYMRLVDSLVANFPQIISFDPYCSSVAPGMPVFFAYIVAGMVKALGGAAPSAAAIDSIAAWVPAVMGALMVIPAFFIGRALSNRWGGLATALTLALMPGQALARSLLGAVDHHAAELLFTLCFALFFMLAVKQGRSFTYEMLRKGLFPPAGSHVPYAMIAGVFMGLYLITWQGALLMVFIAFIFFIAQFLSDHLRELPTDYLSKTAITCFLVALLIFLPVSRDKMTLLALAAVMLVPVALNILSSLMSARDLKPIYFVYAVAGLIAAGTLGAWLAFPAVVARVGNYLYTFFTWSLAQGVVGELRPLFMPGGTFSLEMAWSEFALALYTGLAGLALLAYRCFRRGLPENIFTAAWSIVMMLTAFSMVRFSAYFGVCLAVLSGYLAGQIIERFAAAGDTLSPPGKKERKKAARKPAPGPKRAMAMAITMALFALTLIPGAANSVSLARGKLSTPPDYWLAALDWLKANSPEPMGSDAAYYQVYATPPPDKAFSYPATAYGVAAWNDYGYWITRVAHRIPTSNPGWYPVSGQYPNNEAIYFTGEGKDGAAQMEKWKARYLLVDGRIASPNDKFYALATLTGKKEADYYELCWQKKDNKYVPLLVFYPEFYRTAVEHLYNFDGREVVPQSVPVMTWLEQKMPDGQRFKEITGIRNFGSYSDAQYFISTQKSGKHSIIGTDPLACPVPLEEMKGYRLVYQSDDKASAGSTPVPVIKIFEYRP